MDVTRQILKCIIAKRDTLKCYYINKDAQGLVYEIIMGQRHEHSDLVETLKGCIKQTYTNNHSVLIEKDWDTSSIP
ncbi:uncharacterized protein ACA1_202660 [Acanthamoeba castellanii str. Neff]|uniref:Uncharacterized protein n=1 Tax=Acanthamoeba castellanii (strain ATCC 30010 / Neff) TaxID=1257118 RepID=L8GUH9_ACACF|nr:uncharacterized protein ACA1_202660 [Acanthamoeba castellanii str. Neff]ELR16283.1 hypothetical protein ACA1_202660 [Acanthamoeba castellanii str. Neff]